MMDSVVRIGRFNIPKSAAVGWVADYTDAEANRRSDNPYAYPAYDCFDGERNLPDRLGDSDLLAPILLNVSVSIRSFYGLQRVRERLEARLAQRVLDEPLAGWNDEEIASVIGDIYAVLDDPDVKPWGVNGTTLSKVLHRKRPASLALHDKWVRSCYVEGERAPVPRVADRSWAEYMTLISQAMAKDLHEQAEQFASLQEASKAHPPLSDLRLLDILAWNVGQRPDVALPS